MLFFFFWIFAQKNDKFGDEFLKDFLVGFLLQELGFLVGQTQGWYVYPILTYVTMDHGMLAGVQPWGILGDEKTHKYPRDIGLI